ncbi:uncharacterized protein ACO6RY_01231 [Pungitius sinensis]
MSPGLRICGVSLAAMGR